MKLSFVLFVCLIHFSFCYNPYDKLTSIFCCNFNTFNNNFYNELNIINDKKDLVIFIDSTKQIFYMYGILLSKHNYIHNLGLSLLLNHIKPYKTV